MHAVGAAVASQLDSHQEALKREESRKAREDKDKRIKDFIAGRPKVDDYQMPCLKLYIQAGDFLNDRVTTSYCFESFFRYCISFSAVLMGVQTYNDEEGDWAAVAIIDSLMGVLIVLFTGEVLLKLAAESVAPWRYFRNPQMGRWNTMDLLIVLLCMPYMKSASLGKILRVLRLAKVAASLPKYHVFIMATLDSAENVANISVLISLIMYMYSIAGVLLFRANDPWHFGSLDRSFFTLLSMTTMDGWTAVLYKNMYGCDSYHEKEIAYLAHPWECKTPQARPAVSAVYCISFVTITGLVMLSMFIGVISISMSKIIMHQNEEKLKQKQHDVLERKKQKLLDVAAGVKAKDLSVHKQNKLAELTSYAKYFIQGVEEAPLIVEEPTELRRKVARLAKRCRELEEHRYFDGFIYMLISTGGILAGLKTYYHEELDFYTTMFGTFMTVMFTVEMLLKIAAEAWQPWHYLYKHREWQPWNMLDCGVVIGSYSRVVPPDLLMVFRMLLVLKIMRMRPSLRVSVDSFLAAVAEVGTIGSLISLVFFFFALIGIVLFKANDPGHFLNLHVAMITLFRVATLDTWSEVMDINVYGCAVFQDLTLPASQTVCDENASGVGGFVSSIAASAYFIVFVVVGTFILLNLFIGVIIIAMEKSMSTMAKEQDVMERARATSQKEDYTEKELLGFHEMFNLMDADQSGSVNLDELALVIELSKTKMTNANVQLLLDGIDADGTGEVDFAEFLEFIVKMKSNGRKKGETGSAGLSGLQTSVVEEKSRLYAFLRKHDLEKGFSNFIAFMNTAVKKSTDTAASDQIERMASRTTTMRLGMQQLPKLRTEVRRAKVFIEDLGMLEKYKSWQLIQDATGWPDLEHGDEGDTEEIDNKQAAAKQLAGPAVSLVPPKAPAAGFATLVLSKAPAAGFASLVPGGPLKAPAVGFAPLAPSQAPAHVMIDFEALAASGVVVREELRGKTSPLHSDRQMSEDRLQDDEPFRLGTGGDSDWDAAVAGGTRFLI
jgi:voltage-gated sodium channel